nr:penicillin-binding transpeptidase domain-containing protein [bacterium]
GIELWENGRLGYHPDTNPAPATVTLTINHLTQHIAEEELAASCREYEAKAGTVTVLDVRSGEVLAMASWPTYDPNTPAVSLDTASRANLRNRTITDMFEPGSIFKIFIAAALIERQALDPNRHYFCAGSITRAGRTIMCTHNHGDQTFADVLANSCNVGMVEAVEGIKPEDLYKVLRDFGFGLPTAVELPGEAGGMLHRPAQWSGQSRHSLSFGYEVAVTPMQMACAAAAIANGGMLLQPHLVRTVTTRDGTVLYRGARHEVRRVVSYQTTRTLLQMMRGVIERGTGKSAAIAGFSVAGKTGTARLPNHETGGYYEGRYIGSFIGVAPADDPRLAILVSITDPNAAKGYYGAMVAGPVFQRVAKRILAQLGINPLTTLDQQLKPVTGPRRETKYDQQPGIMPDLKGLSLAEVTRLLGSDFPRARLEGSGLVVEQRPAPGASRWDGELYVRLQ